jgi:hypothetical protein
LTFLEVIKQKKLLVNRPLLILILVKFTTGYFTTTKGIYRIKLLNMKKKIALTLLFISSVIGSQAQDSGNDGGWPRVLKAGVRIQKAQKLYWENGVSFDFATPRIVDGRIHFGASYVTSRIGSAMGSNAIKQDNYLLSAAYHFRHKKQLQPFARFNLGYFHADYEDPIFDVLPNKAFLFPIEGGLYYEFKRPFTLSLSTGYHLNSGTGSSGPGTLFPVFYQMSVYYTL